MKMKSKSQTVEITELIINALDYALTHNLDINNKDDVKKMLEVIDPQRTIELDEFMKLLQDADTHMEMSARKLIKKTDLSN